MTAHPHAAMATSDGWEAVDMDLAELDAADPTRRTVGDGPAAAQAAPAPGHHHARRHHRSSGSATRSSEFNRRVQLVVFVTLLVIGVFVVLRACAGSP